MSEHRTPYRIIPLPTGRQLLIDGCHVGRKKHIIHALIEMDVTRVREKMRARRTETGESLSFTGFVAACLAQAVAEDRQMHAYRRGRSKLVVFDDVDVAMLVERELEDTKLPTFHVIRAADKKTLHAIHQEIRSAQRQPIESTPGYDRWKWFLALPAFIRHVGWWVLVRWPGLWKHFGGTVVLTAVGMFGKGGGWGLPIASHTLTVTLGGISEKPGVVDSRIEIREYLAATISFDHDIIDGVPAAKFTTRFRELVENGFGLDGGG